MSKRQHCPGCHGTHNQWYPGGYSKEPCPGLPASSFRVLPPRPPNVAALLDEEARLPAAEVEAVVEAWKEKRQAFLESKSVPFLSDAYLDAEERRVEASKRLETALEILAALDRKEP